MQGKQFVSLGAGRQSTALTILNVLGKIENPADKFIFADTGNEQPGTYEFIETHLRPWMHAHGACITTVRRSDYFPEPHNHSLGAYCDHHRILPSVAVRWCTDKFKLIPISKYLETVQEYTIAQVGIATEEAHRAHLGEPTKRYPLLERGMSTSDCITVIRDVGLPVPPKSGCYDCPYARKAAYKALREYYPELAKEAVTREKRAISAKNAALIRAARAEKSEAPFTDGEVQEFYRKFPKQRKNLPAFGNLEQFYIDLDNQPGFGEIDPEWLDEFLKQEIKCPSLMACMV
jgi:hypothetical protein